ncbi:hypothetical protein LG289_12885 [Planococcus rifietoensis]
MNTAHLPISIFIVSFENSYPIHQYAAIIIAAYYLLPRLRETPISEHEANG